jgi:hypothetical protein
MRLIIDSFLSQLANFSLLLSSHSRLAKLEMHNSPKFTIQKTFISSNINFIIYC